MTQRVENLSVTSAQLAWYNVKAAAIASSLTALSNWTVPTSSNGVVYAQLGDVITSASSLAVNSWFVLRGHGIIDSGTIYYRELCFQFNGAGAVRIVYSPRLGFVSGTPSVTRVPSATDGELLYGGGTDASPTFTALLPSAGSWMQAWFSEVDDAFWVLCYATGGGNPTALFYLDTIPAQYTTVGALVDGDPCVIYANTGASCGLVAGLGAEPTGAMGLLSLTPTASTLWARLPGSFRAVYDSSAVAQPTIPGGMTTQPSPLFTTPTYPAEALRYGRRTAQSGVTQPGEVGNVNTVGDKGEGTYLRYSGVLLSNPQLIYSYDVGSGSTSSTAIGAGAILLPWGVSIAPSL